MLRAAQQFFYVMLRAALPPRSIQNNICHSARSECNERSRGTHSSSPHSTADAVPPGNISSVTSQKQFAEPTELQVDTAIRDYAQNNGSASTEDIGVTSGYCDYAVLPHSFAQHDIKKSTTQHGRSMTCEKSTAQHDNIYNATQALDKLEQKLDQRLRVAATNFTNNAAQGFVQQSLPQRLLGGHWLTEKFQFLSTLAWQSGDDKGGILGELDIVVPLYGTRDTSETDQSSWFLQPGLVSWEADNGDRRLDVNVGLVYRQRIRERIAVGASVFYDHNIDSNISLVVTSDIPIAGSLTVGFSISEVPGITTGDFTTNLTSLGGTFLVGSESINFNGGRTATITVGTARDGDTAPETYTISLRNSADRSYLVESPRSVTSMINP